MVVGGGRGRRSLRSAHVMPWLHGEEEARAACAQNPRVPALLQVRPQTHEVVAVGGAVDGDAPHGGGLLANWRHLLLAQQAVVGGRRRPAAGLQLRQLPLLQQRHQLVAVLPQLRAGELRLLGRGPRSEEAAWGPGMTRAVQAACPTDPPAAPAAALKISVLGACRAGQHLSSPCCEWAPRRAVARALEAGVQAPAAPCRCC